MHAPTEQACDLHVHTTASDGLLTPLDVLSSAASKGLRAVGIADHDTTAGLRALFGLFDTPREASTGETEAAKAKAKKEPCVLNGHRPDKGAVEVVPGVELNSEWKGRELHILGYYVPLSSGPFTDLLSLLQDSRRQRIADTVKKLRVLGMPVEESRVFELASGESVGRPHVAKAMLERGYVSSIKDAFDRFLGMGRPAYVERYHLSPTDCVRAIREAGGVSVWAHPGTSRSLGLITELVESGLQGIEAYHPEHDGTMVQKCLALAKEHRLIATGGSDFHGLARGEGGDLGSVVVPYEVVERLKEAAGK